MQNFPYKYKFPEKRKYVYDNVINVDDDEYETDDSDEYEEVWCCEHCDKEFEEEYKCEYHEKYCNQKVNDNVICYRCGREGHYATSCYASKHIKGYYLK